MGLLSFGGMAMQLEQTGLPAATDWLERCQMQNESPQCVQAECALQPHHLKLHSLLYLNLIAEWS